VYIYICIRDPLERPFSCIRNFIIEKCFTLIVFVFCYFSIGNCRTIKSIRSKEELSNISVDWNDCKYIYYLLYKYRFVSSRETVTISKIIPETRRRSRQLNKVGFVEKKIQIQIYTPYVLYMTCVESNILNTGPKSKRQKLTRARLVSNVYVRAVILYPTDDY